MEDIVIGIDFGTTNSCVSYFYNGKVRIIENPDGKKLTPSFIFYDNSSVIVGEHAKDRSVHKPDFGIYGIKRLIGRKFSDPLVTEYLKYVPFKVESDASDNPVVVIKRKNGVVKNTPRELCTIILEKLKRDVKDKFGCHVEKVVITVPAYFNVRQREETLAAAKDAGFTVLKLLNEPTAAALSYFHDFDFAKDNSYSLVYDLGGGTFDVAVLKRTKENIEIINVAGDMWLGGQDFDNILFDHVCEQLKEKYHFNAKAENQKINRRRIHKKCEQAKATLSSLQETDIVLTGIVDGTDIAEIHVTRELFETLVDKLCQKTIKIMDICLKSSKIPKDSIQEIILAGGSTRIPKIQQLILSYFGREKLNKIVNQEECVAEGAALQAAMLSTHANQKIEDIKLLEVVPLSLGIANFVDKMDFIIKRNTTIPVSETTNYVTSEPYQKAVYLRVYEGERLNANKNRFLGDLTISDITPAPPGKSEITVTMTVDQNSVLKLTARETCRDNVRELNVNYVRGSKSEREIRESLLDAEKNKHEDEIFERFSEYKAYLLHYCSAMLYNLQKKNLINKYDGIYEYCAAMKSEAKSIDVENEDKLREFISEIEHFCKPVVLSNKFEMPARSFED